MNNVNALIERLKKFDVTQRNLAIWLGVSPSTLSELKGEKHHPLQRVSIIVDFFMLIPDDQIESFIKVIRRAPEMMMVISKNVIACYESFTRLACMLDAKHSPIGRTAIEIVIKTVSRELDL